MTQKELSELTDDELLEQSKKMKSNSTTNALLIGFLVGIIIFSVAKSTWGFLTLIPLFMIYKLVNNPENKKSNQDLEKLLEERKLK